MEYPTEEQNGGAAPTTAFKAAEKRLQLHREQRVSSKTGRRRKGFIVRPTDLSDVVDLQPGAQHAGVTCLGVPSGMPPTAAAYSFAMHPGLLVVRGALEPALQRQLVMDAFTRFCEPPNHTNHTKAYPGGLPGIWIAAQQGLRLQQVAAQPKELEQAHQEQEQQQQEVAPAVTRTEPQSVAPAAPAAGVWGPGGSGPTAESLLVRLRWATLGPPYDWTQRTYRQDVQHVPLPAPLHQLAASLADLAAQLLGEGGDQQGLLAQARPYCPDAALVNFYYEGDTLNGHIDDAERSLDQPLVSLSLGCDAVFLMGGASKDVAPTALLLRSGDALVLSGPARRCYHGLPRVLTDRPLPEALRCGGACGADGGRDGTSDADAASSNGTAREATSEGDPFWPFEWHMSRCRINISLRDTR